MKNTRLIPKFHSVIQKRVSCSVYKIRQPKTTAKVETCRNAPPG